MRIVLLIFVSVFSSIAMATAKFDQQLAQLPKDLKRKDHNVIFNQFLKDIWVYYMETYPEWATSVGYPGMNDKLTDNSLAAVRERKKEPARMLAALKLFKREKLSEDNRLTLDLMIFDFEISAESEKFPGELLAIDQMGNAAEGLSETLQHMPMQTVKDYQDRLVRLQQAPKVLQDNRQILEEGLAQGITPYKKALAKTVASLKEMMPASITASPFYASFKKMPSHFSEDEVKLLQSQAQSVIKDIVNPELKAYTDFIAKEYIPKTRTTSALSDLPNGKEWYDLKIRASTTVKMTADDAHILGLSEVERIRKEMDGVRQSAKFSGSLDAFISHLRATRDHKFSSAQDMLSSYRAFSKTVDGKLPQFFNLMPRLPYGIEPIPAFKAKASPAAYYNSGSINTGIAGTFYLNTLRAREQDRWEIESLTMHEAAPGHHFQIALAQERENLPEVRRYNGYTAYTEGWGLYAETLGYEMGFYTDPYMKFGQLTNEMWRACRLVVDTGLHAKGWSRQQAIDYMKKYLAKPEEDIAVEVDRYIVWPGQALAYKVGQLKISELKAKAKANLGKQFSIRHFHDQILGSGAMPLPLLEKRINEWIDAQLKPVGTGAPATKRAS